MKELPAAAPVAIEEEIGGFFGMAGGLFDGPSDSKEPPRHNGVNDGGQWVWHQRQPPLELHINSAQRLPSEQRFRSPSYDYAAGYPDDWQDQNGRNTSDQPPKRVHWDWGSNVGSSQQSANEQSTKGYRNHGRPSTQRPLPGRSSSYDRVRSSDRRFSGPRYESQRIDPRERRPSNTTYNDDKYRDEPPGQWGYGNGSAKRNNSGDQSQREAPQRTQRSQNGWDDHPEQGWRQGSGNTNRGNTNAPRQASQSSRSNNPPPSTSFQPPKDYLPNPLPNINQPWLPHPLQHAPVPDYHMPGPPQPHFPWPMPMPVHPGLPHIPPRGIPSWPLYCPPHMQPIPYIVGPPGSGSLPPPMFVPARFEEDISPKNTSYNQSGQDPGQNASQNAQAGKPGNTTDGNNNSGDWGAQGNGADSTNNNDQNWSSGNQNVGNDNDWNNTSNSNQNGANNDGWNNNSNDNNNVNSQDNNWEQGNDNGNAGNSNNDDWVNNNDNNNNDNAANDDWGNTNSNSNNNNNNSGDSWGKNNNSAAQANTSGDNWIADGADNKAAQPAQESILEKDIARNLYGPHGPYYSLRAINLDDPKPDAEEEPRFDVPKSIAAGRSSTKQVQPGPGYRYYKKSITPEYIDTLDNPYARFVFKYRTREQVLDEIGIEIDVEPSSNQEVTDLQNLDKQTLVEMLMRAKSALGGKVPSPPSTPVPTAGSDELVPVTVPAPSYPYLKYNLPPLRPMTANSNRKASDQTKSDQGLQNKENNARWDTTNNNATNNNSGDGWGNTNGNGNGNQNWGGNANWNSDGPAANSPAVSRNASTQNQNQEQQQRQASMQGSAQSRQNSQPANTGGSNGRPSSKGTSDIPPRPQDDPNNEEEFIPLPQPLEEVGR